MAEHTLKSLKFGDPAAVDESLSDCLRGLVGSEILKIAADIRALVAEGRSLCNLTVGDFNSEHFPIPDALLRGIHRAYDEGETNYPPADGVLALREAVSAFVAREWGPQYPPESVMIAGGARPILYAAYRCVLNRGEKVIYPVPSWNNNHYTWLAEAEGIVVPALPEDGFMPTLRQIEPHLSQARMLCLNSPLNPTGTVIAREALQEIVQAVVEENRKRSRQGRRHMFLLHDQVYATLVFGDAQHFMPVSLVPESAPWVISLDGISKSLAATGLRVGWVLAAPPLVRRMKNLVGHMGAWAPRPEQVALAEFLQNRSSVSEFQQEMNRRVEGRLTALFAGFQQMRRDGYPVECVNPEGAIYLSLHLDLVGRRVRGSRMESNDMIRRLLLDGAGLAVVPFQAFGLAEETGWFRLSVGAVSLDEIDEAFPRLRRLLDDVD